MNINYFLNQEFSRISSKGYALKAEDWAMDPYEFMINVEEEQILSFTYRNSPHMGEDPDE